MPTTYAVPDACSQGGFSPTTHPKDPPYVVSYSLLANATILVLGHIPRI